MDRRSSQQTRDSIIRFQIVSIVSKARLVHITNVYRRLYAFNYFYFTKHIYIVLLMHYLHSHRNCNFYTSPTFEATMCVIVIHKICV